MVTLAMARVTKARTEKRAVLVPEHAKSDCQIDSSAVIMAGSRPAVARLVEREFLAPNHIPLVIHNELKPTGLARPNRARFLTLHPLSLPQLGWWCNTDSARVFAVVWLGKGLWVWAVGVSGAPTSSTCFVLANENKNF